MKGRDESQEDFGYGEGSRYAAHLDRGWSMLDRGDHQAARKAAEHAQTARPDDPDAAVLLGAIALAEGDGAESLRCYERAMELDPEYLEPYAAAAQVCLLDLDDPPRALRYCDDALEIEGLSPFELLDVQLLAAECELAGDRVEAARARLETIDEGALQAALELLAADDDEDADDDLEIDLGTDRGAALAFLRTDPDGEPLDDDDRAERTGRVLSLGLRLGRLRLDVDDGPRASRGIAAIAERFSGEPDAWHLWSEAAHRTGDLAAAAVAGLRTLELDAETGLPDWVPSPAIVHRRALRVLSESGDREVAALVAGSVPIAILVREQPPAELVLEGVDPRIGALTLAGRAGGDEPPQLLGLAIYRSNLARFARDAEQFEQELRLSVLDEVTAFLGLSDARRDDLGLPPLPAVLREPPPPPPPPPAEDAEPPKRPRGRRRRASTTKSSG